MEIYLKIKDNQNKNSKWRDIYVFIVSLTDRSCQLFILLQLYIFPFQLLYVIDWQVPSIMKVVMGPVNMPPFLWLTQMSNPKRLWKHQEWLRTTFVPRERKAWRKTVNPLRRKCICIQPHISNVFHEDEYKCNNDLFQMLPLEKTLQGPQQSNIYLLCVSYGCNEKPSGFWSSAGHRSVSLTEWKSIRLPAGISHGHRRECEIKLIPS